MFIYDTINTLLAIIFLFNTALLFPLLRNVKNNVQTFTYAVNIVTILLWVITMMGYRSETIYFDVWLRSLYVVAIFIGVTYMQFALFYPITLHFAKYYIYAVNSIAFATAYLVTLTDTIIVRGVATEYGEPHIIFGAWYPLYIAIILIPFITGFARHGYLLVERKGKLVYLLGGYFMSANIAFVTNLILPWMGIFTFNWVGQLCTVIMVLLTTYSILRFNVMNIRFFSVNVGVTLLLIVTFSQTLFADSLKNLIVSGIVFLISLITGGYLVMLSQNERKSLEHTVSLNKEIQKVNEQLGVANEQLKSLDVLKSEFISLASHQLRSPLTVIKGYASTLTDGIVGDLNPKQAEIVNHIYASAQSLASMVEEFLNVSKIEQGGMKYSFERVDIVGLVASLADEMKRTAEDKHLAFSISGTTDGVCMVQADAVKLRQVFLNLIDNSIKYTQEGFVHVSLEKKISNKEVIITISDSGIGISEETKKKLFTKFGRGEEVSSHSGGSGLGLYLAQEVVKAHHGVIHVQSKGLHLGASFSVILPCTI